MADHKVSVAVSLLVFSLLDFQHIGCQQSNFRVFRTGAELREFEQLSARERLDAALQVPGAAILEITGANQAATVQEDVALNIDCLPWLRRFPGGSIQWYSIQLDEFGNIMDPVPRPENPTQPGDDARITVGGDFNRWLNISRIELVGVAEDPDSKIFQCEVCIARGSPFQVCHTANYTNRVIGGPPVVNTTGINECHQGAMPGSDILLTETLLCPVPNEVPRPVPPPTITWFRDGVPAASASLGETFTVNMAFLVEFSILNPGVFGTISPFQVFTDGDLVFTTEFTNITNPIMGGLAPDITFSEARAMLFDILLANWTCVANNTLGLSSVSNFFRMCGDIPVIPDCAAADGSRVLFLDDGDAAPPGCDVCILPGTTVTLNCMVSSGTPPISYSWIMNGVEVSQNPRLTVREPGNYSCTATNLDSGPIVEASVLFFSPRATLTSRIVGRTTDGCERLLVNETELASTREQFDTCIFVDETLEVECTSDDPDAVLALMSADGTMYENATARFMVTAGNFDAANQTFMCAITNAMGSCGGFVFQSSVRVYDPAEIDRTIDFVDSSHLGAGRFDDVRVGMINMPVTLRCPTSGIPNEMTEWRRVVEDMDGCFTEEPISPSDLTDGITITEDMTGALDDLVLTIDNFNATFEGTYVCRTENIAGRDADVVTLVTGLGSPEWRTTEFSECTMMCEDGNRSRSVTCRNDRDSLIVPDFMCQDVPGGAGPRPVSTLQCNDLFPLPCFLDPVWVPHPWSRCTQDCKGTRTRRVLCQVPRTGEVRPNYECNNLRPKPTRSEVCPDKCCVADVYPGICSSFGSGYCGMLAYQKLCCWTCGLTVIP